MKPISLRLKGFLGIKAGLGVDDITLDLESLPEGIVVLSGANGSGKSTIIDNLTPYRLMPYRAGATYSPAAFSYYDQCYGDAVKDFTFEIAGQLYRSLITIDADARKQEAYLFRWGDDQWQTMPGIDGKLASYDRAVEDLVGSPQLFFTSIFRCQNARALAEYSKGDIKGLFVELLNIDHLRLLSEKARRIKVELTGKHEILTVQRKQLGDTVGSKEATTIMLAQAEQKQHDEMATIDELTRELVAIQGKIAECDLNMAVYEQSIENARRLARQIADKKRKEEELKQAHNRRAASYVAREAELADKREKANIYISALPKLRKDAAEKAKLDTTIRELRESLPPLEEKHTALLSELSVFAAIETAVAQKEKQLQIVKLQRDHAIRDAERSLAEANRTAARLNDVPCSLDMAQQCRFVADAVAAKGSIPKLTEALAAAQINDSGDSVLIGEIADLKTRLAERENVRAEIDTVKTRINTLRAKLKQATDLSEKKDVASTLARAELASATFDELLVESDHLAAEKLMVLSSMLADIVEVQTEIKDLKDQIEASPEVEDLKRTRLEYKVDLDDIQRKVAAAKSRERAHNQSIGGIHESLRRINKAEEDMEILVEKMHFLNEEISQWALLEKAFGDNGVIALQLDDAGPQITAMANELLKEYGGRFVVKLETQTVKADNKGMKEVFDILVIDGETNETKSVRRMSGGERTWIEDSITKAISLYSATASGRRFEVTYSDEKDGALDPLKKREFFSAKRRAMKLGGYRNEICITQTTELASMADAVITMKDGGIEVSTQS